MNCTQCGTLLPEQAKFCLQCGAAVVQAAAADAVAACHVVFRQIDEKWSLFGKEIWHFEAVTEDGSVVAVSDKITITGFELSGPNEKSRKYKQALDGLVKKLLDKGWQQSGVGQQWFELQFQHSSQQA